jgi:hypothetical protein
LLVSYGIVVDEHTPWWQTLATAAATAGISPARFTQLITAIREITAHVHPK